MKKLFITLLSLISTTYLLANETSKAIAADAIQHGSMSNLVRLWPNHLAWGGHGGPQGGVVTEDNKRMSSHLQMSSPVKKNHLLGGKNGKQKMSISLRGLNEENRLKVYEFVASLRNKQQKELQAIIAEPGHTTPVATETK